MVIPNGSHMCLTCGVQGKPKKFTKGSIWLEIAIWLVFFPIGVVYTMWRLTSKFEGCPHCKTPTMVPAYSPMGRKMQREMEAVGE